MDGKQIFDALEKKASAAITPEEGDYVVDGLLYCHKCHTPKQTRIDVFGAPRVVMCICKCMKEQFEKEEREKKQREFEARKDRLRRDCFSTREMHGWTFDCDDGENKTASQISRRYVENFVEMLKHGKGLLLYGDVGTGKTFFATCIANALIDKGYSCLVTNFSSMTNKIMGLREDKQDYIDSLERYSLLVIDDMGAERETSYMDEIMHNVIDSRYRSGKPLIITTNLTAQQLAMPEDLQQQRIYSRILEMCIPVEIKGKDKRKRKAVKGNRELKELLGIMV